MPDFERKTHTNPKSTSHRFTSDETQVLHAFDVNDQREMTIRVLASAEDSEDCFQLMGYLGLPSDEAALRPIQKLLRARR